MSAIGMDEFRDKGFGIISHPREDATVLILIHFDPDPAELNESEGA